MAAILGNGSVTFGDGSVQTTKTPTVVSAFTNNANYLTDATISASYATKPQAVASMYVSSEFHGSINIQGYNLSGTQIITSNSNCNCNC